MKCSIYIGNETAPSGHSVCTEVLKYEWVLVLRYSHLLGTHALFWFLLIRELDASVQLLLYQMFPKV